MLDVRHISKSNQVSGVALPEMTLKVSNSE